MLLTFYYLCHCSPELVIGIYIAMETATKIIETASTTMKEIK